MNIAGQTFDVYDDTMLKIASAHKNELAGLTVLDPTVVESLPDSDFALVIKTGSQKIRKYPIVDADSTKLSSCYFAAQKNTMHPALVKTAESGFKRGPNEIDISKLSAVKPITHSFRNYPLHDDVHVKEAMARFEYTTQRMEPMDKHAYANAIVNRACDLNLEVSGKVLDYISPEVNPYAVKIGCMMRKQVLRDSELKADLDKIAEKPSPAAFEAFDKVAHLTDYVREGKIPDAYETCYSIVKAAAFDAKNIPLIKIEGLFDASFAKEWAKDPVAVFNSLPDPTKAMIEKNAGVLGDSMKMVPAALAMLAVGAVAKNMGAKSEMDRMMDIKGWAPSKEPGVFYQKGEQKIIRKNNMFQVVDFDGTVKSEAESLPKILQFLG